jgi:hypothetical protein
MGKKHKLLFCIIHKKWIKIYKHKNIRTLRIMFKKFYLHIFFPSAPIFGHLLRRESLEVGFDKKHKKSLNQ